LEIAPQRPILTRIIQERKLVIPSGARDAALRWLNRCAIAYEESPREARTFGTLTGFAGGSFIGNAEGIEQWDASFVAQLLRNCLWAQRSVPCWRSG
jgi:hypothetical protein